MSDLPDDPDLLAGEYVLGVLDAADAQDVRRRAQTDPSLSRAIDAWEDRLTPLSMLADPIEPPAELWARIDASIGGAVNDNTGPLQRMLRGPGIWRITTAAALALAAAFAGVAFLRPAPPVIVAALSPVNAPGSVFLARIARDGSVEVPPLGAVTVPSDRDLELWALPAGTTRPLSLGVITAAARSVSVPGLPAVGTQLLVSLEPKGGSPTGRPTGPVLYAGRLSAIE